MDHSEKSLNPLCSFKGSIPWTLLFIAKVLGFVVILDVAVFPILWILRVPLPQGYIAITCYQGLCMVIIGGLLLFTSLFSTIEQENHKYVGLGTYRYGLRSTRLTKEEKSKMKKKGILLMIIGISLFLPTFTPLHVLLLSFHI